MNTLPEMNMTNLAKISGMLPIALQFKWRDKALRIRERRGFPNLKHLVDFIERRAEAANDPVFGWVGETSKAGRKYPRGGHQTLPPIPRGAVDSKVMTKATQVGQVGVRIHLSQISIRTLQRRKVLVGNATVAALRTG